MVAKYAALSKRKRRRRPDDRNLSFAEVPLGRLHSSAGTWLSILCRAPLWPTGQILDKVASRISRWRVSRDHERGSKFRRDGCLLQPGRSSKPRIRLEVPKYQVREATA